MTVYDRGHKSAQKIMRENKFIPEMLNPDRREFHADMLASLLYIAWRDGWQASAKHRKSRKERQP